MNEAKETAERESIELIEKEIQGWEKAKKHYETEQEDAECKLLFWKEVKKLKK